jgi:dolichyl-phosphate beta-glucosyltransferase
MQAASGSTQLFMDADLATPLHHIEDALQLIEHKATDIVIGVRDIRKMHHSKRRFAISLIGNLCFSVVSGRYLPDTQCGFKAFSKKASGACFSRLTRDNWSFDMELMVIAFQNGLTIAQLPIYDWKDVPGGTFKGYLGNSLQFLKDLGMIFYNRIASRYS